MKPVDIQAGPALVRHLEARAANLVAIERHLLEPGCAPSDACYLCVAFKDRRSAYRLLLALIEAALDDADLRDELTGLGHPKLREIGDRCFVLWPELLGRFVRVH